MASPFVRRKVLCPICEKESVQFSLMPNLYSVEEKEEDQHPLRLNWYNPDFQDVKPQWYLLFHCPYCLFTDFEEAFTKTQAISNFQSLRTGYIKPNPTKSKVLQLLRNKISYENMDFTSALFVHLNAIYIYELESREQYKDIKKLARLYHRTAWLFREQQTSTDSGTDDLLKKDIHKNIDTLTESFSEFNKKFNPLTDNIKRRVLDLGVKFDDPNNPYLPSINEFNSLSEQIQKVITKIRVISTKDKDLLENIASGNQNGNYEEYLAQLTECWPTVPMNERDCLNKAIDNYEKQYQKIDSNDSLNQQIGVMNILVELCLRVNNYKKAFEYLASLYQFCATSKQNLYSQQRQNPSPLAESHLNKLGDVMFNLSEKRKMIEQKQMEYFTPQIKKFIDDNNQLEWQEAKEELLKQDIPEEVLDTYSSGNEADEEEYEENDSGGSKKKKRWGIF